MVSLSNDTLRHNYALQNAKLSMHNFGLLTVIVFLLFTPICAIADQGDVDVTLSTLDPYLQTSLGFQVAEPLYLSLRQTAEISSITNRADRLYPGMDIKLILIQEDAYIPKTTLNLQSALGHKRMAGESLELSKRYKAFNATAGLAWGRLGSRGSVPNPLAILSDHFGKNRALDGEMPNAPQDWFTGNSIGLFAGLDYTPPTFDNLTLHAGWGADGYKAEETAIAGFHAPRSSWELGAQYSPTTWATLGAKLVGGNKVMGSVTLKNNLKKLALKSYKNKDPPPVNPARSGDSAAGSMESAAATQGFILSPVEKDSVNASGVLALSPDMPLPLQVGRAARAMNNHGGTSVESFHITPTLYGLRGASVHLIRRDFEQALARKQGSAEELWRHASFDPSRTKTLPIDNGDKPPPRIRFILENQTSLSEEDTGILHRESLIGEIRHTVGRGFIMGSGLRLNLADNLSRIDVLRPAAILPVRSNVSHFAQRRVAVDRVYIGWLKTLKTDVHLALTAGQLEEMYGGFGGEILYRPFGKTWAIGADMYEALKRDPAYTLNLGYNGDHLLTGHVNAWYEIPQTNMTAQLRLGRYLAQDLGGTLALSNRFENGAALEAFVTTTDAADFDLFGGTTHVYSGVKFSVPLGSIKYIPQGSEARFTLAPFGRDAGQSLDPPVTLYDTTEAFSYRAVTHHWAEILK
jgi:hypothetical protein